MKIVDKSITLFENYIQSFKGLEEEQTRNFQIKRTHTFRVIENMEFLGNQVELSDEDRQLAVLIALFHDIGRFPQLIKYNTFDDAQSEDHAALGIGVLNEKDALVDLDEESRNLILIAIEGHNKFQLSSKLNEREKLFSKLIRDADKLDILKVITDYYANKNRQVNHTITWDYPDSSGISPAASEAIIKGLLVPKSAINNQNDIKIMQMSWVYDLNFKASFKLLNERRYMEKIYNTLPKKDEVFDIYRKIKIYTENQFLAIEKDFQ